MLNAADVRKRRITGALSAVLGLTLIVLAVLALTGSLGATTKEPADEGDGTSAQGSESGTAESDATQSGAAESESSSQAPPDAEKLPLTVLNGSTTSGLAALGQTAFEAGSWPVAEVGNFTDDSPSQSTVYYPADDEAAQASAELLVSEFPELTTQEAPADFGYSGLVVVLTGDWTPS